MFFAVLVALLFIQLFATFRGLSSASAMDSAQIAREMARGNGFHTKVIRPYAWQQKLQGGRDEPLAQMVDSHQPPLPALVLAPLFHLFRDHWDFPEGSRLYPLDRVVAGVSLLFFVGTMGLVYLTVQRLFDGWIAGWTVTMMLVCQFFWEAGRAGLAPMMLLFFVSLAFYWMVAALERQEQGEPGAGWYALGIALLAAAMVMTHWMAIGLVAGLTLVVALWFRPRALALLVFLLPLAALGAWGYRNQLVSGDVLGSAKAVLQAALMTSGESWLARDFSGATPPMDLGFLLRKIQSNFVSQIGSLYTHLGMVVPALFFFPALLHTFKREETRRIRWALAILWVGALLGMCFVGLPAEDRDENQLHLLFIPLFTAYGLAFLTVLWVRLGFSHAGWWGRNALVLGVFLVSASPMISVLPMEVLSGLYNKGQFAHWPPYLPDRLAKVKEFTESNELVYTDTPWALAWYADCTAVWLPMEVAQFQEMRQLSLTHGEKVAGMLFTPYSAKTSTVPDIFFGEYRAWAPEIYRGAGIGLGLDTLAIGEFPFKEIFPLAGQPVGSRFLVQMAFMSDKKRWEVPPAAK